MKKDKPILKEKEKDRIECISRILSTLAGAIEPYLGGEFDGGKFILPKGYTLIIKRDKRQLK